MLRPVLATRVGAVLLLVAFVAACGGGSAATPTGGGGAGPGASVAPGSAGAGSGSGASAMFGGDVCSALTGAEVAGATYPQGQATDAGTDTEKDADTGQAVVCQYLVTFGDNPSIVVVAVTLLSPEAYANRTRDSLLGAPEAVSGVGDEAWIVLPAPGMTEVYVMTAHGAFKVSCPTKDNAVPFAKLAAGRA